MKWICLSLLATLAIILSSCATIIYGTKQTISVQSDPSDAEVYINGKYYGNTPCLVSVKRKQKKSDINEKNELHYILKKSGYEDRHIIDHRRITWAAYLDGYLNVPFGLLFIASCAGDPEVAGTGWSIGLPMVASIPLDMMTGSLYSYNKLIEANLNIDIYKKIEPGNNKNAKDYTYIRNADVDNNIPETAKLNENRFALIIGNEDYSSQQTDLTTEANVPFARDDASAFNEYAIKVLGIPQENITFMLDATSGKMKQALDKMNKLAKNSMGNAELFFYYAGHGLPDEVSKEPYLIPVDISGNNVADGIKLEYVYQKLTEYPSKNVTVFLDACFSGGARNQGLIAARGVKVKPKENMVKGKLVVFTASTGEQSSLSYKDKSHGLFTYFLLLKLQESQGEVTYKELSDYLSLKVGLKSVMLNNKEQNPQVNVSPEIQNQWQNWKFR